MRAMLFAAGLGSRLQPLTLTRPKALVEVAQQTVLERAIRLLASQGVTQFVINVHHFADEIEDFVKGHGYFGLDIQFSDERAQLLETGGGLLKAAAFFEGNAPIILYNTDILSNIDINKMMEFHHRGQALASLAVRKRPSSRQLLFDTNRQLSAWKNEKTGELKRVRAVEQEEEWAFSGIHIIEPTWFDLVTQKGKFSIIDSYLDLAKEHDILAYPHETDYWFDIGKPEYLAEARAFFEQDDLKFDL